MKNYPKFNCEGDNLRFYLPPLDADTGYTDVRAYLYRYTDREFPKPKDDQTVVYSIPKCFSSTGERQATLAENQVFQRLHGVTETPGLWITFFHSTCYAGHSHRNQRLGRLMIREHDFVVFAKYQGRFYVALIEVKSNNDSNTKKDDLEKTSDAKVIKNNKRSAQHQLRDHMEVLRGIVGDESKGATIQIYIMWPFLGAYTKDPRQQTIRRWKEDKNLHVFEDVISSQEAFNGWFSENVLKGSCVEEKVFATLLNRFIVLSCGVFMNEIHKDLLALLTQQQLDTLNSDVCSKEGGGPLVVYGAAGTGKTLLVLRKLDQLHRTGRLNDQNRALYMCFWPGIRTEVKLKLQAMGIAKYVDTVRFYVSMGDFLRGNNKNYKHIFMDEAEAVCLSFHQSIIRETISEVYSHYHNGNCDVIDCPYATLDSDLQIARKIKEHRSKDWGELWFMIDSNQAMIFLPKYSPADLRAPTFYLSKIMRSTRSIFNLINTFYNNPILRLPKPMIGNVEIPSLSVGHDIDGPPVYWVRLTEDVAETTASVIIDLCATKGVKPNDICVIPYMLNENTVPERINKHIENCFVENTYHPNAVSDAETFIMQKQLNDFLVSWALKVKGLEFTVVIMPIEDDDFDLNDLEDRKKAYIISSRSTCMLIFICNDEVRCKLQLGGILAEYPFNLKVESKPRLQENAMKDQRVVCNATEKLVL